MSPTHQPEVKRGPNGTWLVECPQCRADLGTDIPIGIGLPLVARETAEQLRMNHSGPYGRRLPL